jgi:hypothetical protein
MQKRKSAEYIMGMITGASIMLAVWACSSNELVASNNYETVKIESSHWDPVYVTIVE